MQQGTRQGSNNMTTHFNIGDHVRITGGQLKGLEGKVVRIYIELIGVAVEEGINVYSIHPTDLEHHDIFALMRDCIILGNAT